MEHLSSLDKLFGEVFVFRDFYISRYAIIYLATITLFLPVSFAL